MRLEKAYFLSYNPKMPKIIGLICFIILFVTLPHALDDRKYYIGFWVGLVVVLLDLAYCLLKEASIGALVHQYGADKLNDEMIAENAVLFERKTYITEHYIICHTYRPYITVIADVVELEYSLSGGSFVYGILKDGNRVKVAKVIDEKSADLFINLVKDRNREIV